MAEKSDSQIQPDQQSPARPPPDEGTVAEIHRTRFRPAMLAGLGLLVACLLLGLVMGVGTRSMQARAIVTAQSDDRPIPAPPDPAPVTGNSPKVVKIQRALNRADALLIDGRAVEAREIYESLVGLVSDDAIGQLHYRLAVAIESVGKLRDALSAYRDISVSTADVRLRLACQLGQARSWLAMGRPMSAAALLYPSSFSPSLSGSQVDDLAGDLHHLLALSLTQIAADLRPASPLDDGFCAFGHPTWYPLQLLRYVRPSRTEPAPGPIEKKVSVLYRYGDHPEEIQLRSGLDQLELADALEHLSRATGVAIELSPVARSKIRGVNVQVRTPNRNLGAVLDGILQPVGLGWLMETEKVKIVAISELDSGKQEALYRKRAVRALRHAVTNHPDHGFATLSSLALANFEFIAGHLEEAKSQFTKLIDDMNETEGMVEARCNLGKIAILNADHQTAEDAFADVVDSDDEHPLQGPAQLYLGSLLLEKEERGAAIRPLMRALGSANDTRIKSAAAVPLASAYLFANNFVAANTALVEESEFLKDSPYAKLAVTFASLARFRMANGTAAAVHQGRQLVSAIADVNSDDMFSVSGVLVLGDAMRSLGMALEMEEQYRQSLGRPLRPWLRDRFRLELLDHYEQIHDFDSAGDVLQQLMADADQEDRCYYELRLAELEYNHGNSNRCLTICRELVRQCSVQDHRDQALRLMGRVFEDKEDHYRAAICFAGMIPRDYIAEKDLEGARK